MVLIFQSEPSKECAKVSHVIFECRVINQNPTFKPSTHDQNILH